MVYARRRRVNVPLNQRVKVPYRYPVPAIFSQKWGKMLIRLRVRLRRRTTGKLIA